MAGDAIQNVTDFDSATDYLSKIAEHLAAGSVTRDEADEAIAKVLALPVFEDVAEDQLDAMQASWGRNFDSSIKAREQAGATGSLASNTAGPSRTLEGSGVPTQTHSEEETLRQQARASLAAAEQRRNDNCDAIQVILDAIGKDSTAATPDKSLFGWASDAQDVPIDMHPDAAHTLIIVENYSRSMETTKNSLLIQPSKPDFPSHLWGELLRNQYIDLNKVHSHLHAPHQASRVVEKFSNTFSLVTTTGQAPDRKIKSASEWCYAWTEYSRAVVFAFRHRRREFEDWNDFIMQLFSTTSESYHNFVISMEASMRRHIFGNQSLCLWDRRSVEHLQHAYLSPTGSESRVKRSAPSGVSGDAPKAPKRIRNQVDEICKRFNMGTCIGACVYKRACADCGGGHSRLACPKASTGGSGARSSQ